MSNRGRGARDWVIGHPWALILAALVVAVALWAKGTREEPHEIRAVFTEAVSLYPGLDVRVDGLDAGKITKVERSDGQAVVTLGISDPAVWPLHRGTTAALRFGSTIGNGTRMIDVTPGPASAPLIPDGGIILNRDTIEATEFDQVFSTFDAKTRRALRGTLRGTGDTFGPRAPELAAGVKATGPGLDAVGGLMGDLAADGPALAQFVANTDRVTRTLGARHDQIASLVTVASATFATFAANTRGIAASLDRFPPAARETRATLTRLDTSLGHLNGLVTDLDPGARELALLGHRLRPALASLRRTAPVASAAFRAGRRAAPSITDLLVRSQPFSMEAAPVLADLAPMFGCLRPYSPEIAGLLSTWTSWNQPYDSTGHIGRLWGNGGAASATAQPANSEQFTQATGQGYALVRAPGYNAGQPIYQPQCGITSAGTDVTKDPESGG